MVNKSELARKLKLSRPTVAKYIELGMPAEDLDGAAAWVRARKESETRTGKPDSSQYLDLRNRLLEASIAEKEASARLREYEADVQSRNLVPLDEAKNYIAEILGPLRVLLDGLPKGCAVKCNPTDPTLAEDSIREGLEGVFKAMDGIKGGNGSA